MVDTDAPSYPRCQSAIGNVSRPFQRAFAPGIVITDYQNSDKDEHLDQGELGKREVVTHENNGPRQQEDCLDIEDLEQHHNNIITHGEAFVSASLRIDAALVGPHLVFLIFPGSQKSPE